MIQSDTFGEKNKTTIAFADLLNKSDVKVRKKMLKILSRFSEIGREIVKMKNKRNARFLLQLLYEHSKFDNSVDMTHSHYNSVLHIYNSKYIKMLE